MKINLTRQIIIAISMLSICSCSSMEVATNSLLLADWSQTRQIAADSAHIEVNPILGSNPSSGDVDLYFGGCIIINTILHRVLPESGLKYYQAGLLAVEVGAVGNNLSHGIGIKVDF